MKRMTCADKIRLYLEENQISAERVALDTGTPLNKLNGKSSENLSAAEFLEICAYLNINPKEMR